MQKNSPKKRFILLLGVQIAIIVFVAMFFFIDFDRLLNDDDTTFISPNTPCDLHLKTCRVKLSPTQEISLEIVPKGIPLMKPLSFIVHAKGVKTDTIKLKIYAINMEMGTHKVTLKRVSKDRFEGRQVLPTCIVGGMIWNADLTSSSFFKKQGVRFSFKTDI